MARRLLLLNGLAVLGVVLNHASSWTFIGMFWWADRYRDVAVPNFDQLGSASYYVLRLVEQAVAFTVPSFLFVSGFFVTFIGDRDSLSRMWLSMGTRIRTLLVPYLIWSTILLAERFVSGERLTFVQYLLVYVMGRAADPYYFVPLLCQCLLLAPLLVAAARRNWKALLIGTALLHLGMQAYQYAGFFGTLPPWTSALRPFMGGWLFPSKLIWFALGVVVGLHLEAVHNTLRAHRALIAGVAVILVPLGIIEWELVRLNAAEPWVTYRDTLVDSLYALSIIAVVMTFDPRALPWSDSLQDLGKHSYGIYLVHSVVLAYSARVVYHLAPWLLGITLAYFVYLVVLGLGLPLVLMKVVRESRFKGSYKFIFG